ncbi:GspE/PulE family protein [Bacteriovoracaceae bacterium]|nr:GspE/PulE family protein [Bacteriovoracaceae bacterium]
MSDAKKLEKINRSLVSIKNIIHQLKNEELIDEITAQKILKENKNSKDPIHLILSRYKIQDRRYHDGVRFFTMDDWTEYVARKVGLPFEKIDATKIEIASASAVVPHAYARRLQILPLSISEDTINMAITDPFKLDWVQELEKVSKKKIKLILANPVQIKQLLTEFFVIQKEIKKLSSSQSSQFKKLVKDGNTTELDSLIEKGRQRRWGKNDSTIVKIVDWLINYAFIERASDIHLEPKKGLGHIRFRIDGKLRRVYSLDPDALLSVISRVKILGDMKIDEKRRPQDGRIKRFLDNGKQIEMRLSVVPTLFGEKLVMRLFDQQVAASNLDFIGLKEFDQKVWNELIHSSQGLVLVTGPTGSGKTTTLYTSLNLIATEEINICTIEDPIEMIIPKLNQVQMSEELTLNFPQAIKSFLRQDPDVIMVGEIRDHQTAEAAIQASLTGHLVFSTLHTNGALATIQRLIDLKLPTFLINSALKAVLAQRLVRRLCAHCRKKIETPEDKWETIKDDLNIEMPEHIWEPAGCHECKNTGYMGRLVIYELVLFNNKIKKAIHPHIEMIELKEKTRGEFTTFRENSIEKLINGETSLQEILEVVY